MPWGALSAEEKARPQGQLWEAGPAFWAMEVWAGLAKEPGSSGKQVGAPRGSEQSTADGLRKKAASSAPAHSRTFHTSRTRAWIPAQPSAVP